MKTYYGFKEDSNLLTQPIITTQIKLEGYILFESEKEAVEKLISLLNYRSKRYEKRAERLADLLDLIDKANNFKTK